MKYIMLKILSIIVAVLGYAIRIPVVIIQLTVQGISRIISAICEKTIEIADEINYVSDDIAYHAESKTTSYENT